MAWGGTVGATSGAAMARSPGNLNDAATSACRVLQGTNAVRRRRRPASRVLVKAGVLEHAVHRGDGMSVPFAEMWLKSKAW